MWKNITGFIVLCSLSANSVALECTRPIQKIFTGYTATTSKVHVDHGDGYGASVVRLPYVNNDEAIVDRILSVLLAAHLAGRQVRFRYSLNTVNGNPAECTSTEGLTIEAVWIN